MTFLNKRKRRINGIERPLEQLQIITWIAVLISWSTYFTLVIPFLPDNTRYPILIAYLGIIVIGLPFYIWLLFMDPKHHHIDAKSRSAEDIKKEDDEPTSTCHYCQIQVNHSTKHCRICNKCIEGFDHHCLYLNTCIGQRNYWQFFVMISLVTLLLGLQIGSTLLLIIKHNETEYKEIIDDSIFADALPLLILLCILSAVPLIGFFAILSLELFHIYIIILGVTTYEWIIDRRDRKEKELEREAEEEVKRRQAELDKRKAEVRKEWLRERAKTSSKKSKSNGALSYEERQEIEEKRRKSLEEDDDAISHRMSYIGIGDFRQVEKEDDIENKRVSAADSSIVEMTNINDNQNENKTNESDVVVLVADDSLPHVVPINDKEQKDTDHNQSNKNDDDTNQSNDNSNISNNSNKNENENEDDRKHKDNAESEDDRNSRNEDVNNAESEDDHNSRNEDVNNADSEDDHNNSNDNEHKANNNSEKSTEKR